MPRGDYDGDALMSRLNNDATTNPNRYRERKLANVFKRFDLDSSGAIEAAELMILGQARRELAHRSGTWTKDMNAKLVSTMDRNGDGKISLDEFTRYFNSSLPPARDDFDAHVSNFLQVADTVRKAKEEQRKEQAQLRPDASTNSRTTRSIEDRVMERAGVSRNPTRSCADTEPSPPPLSSSSMVQNRGRTPSPGTDDHGQAILRRGLRSGEDSEPPTKEKGDPEALLRRARYASNPNPHRHLVVDPVVAGIDPPVQA